MRSFIDTITYCKGCQVRQGLIESAEQRIAELEAELATRISHPEDVAQDAERWRAQQWVSVLDSGKHPPEMEQVLLSNQDGKEIIWIASGTWEEGFWWLDATDDKFPDKYYHTVTHWMPMNIGAAGEK